jgi:site-specific DNA recombinase
VRRLIEDPTAKGLRRSNYTQTTNNKKAWKLKAKDHWVYHSVEAIVSEELWTECAANLDARKGTRKKLKWTPKMGPAA